ncbi:MAG: TetR/AcrR family transcriptional regulator [Methanobacterium sp.]|nr:TetR/AcrR family transcriptional regulator [Methanobacterium sp.]
MMDETKTKILDAALNIFAKEGYNSATTRSIASKSGFSEITLFRKFETKENLFKEAMSVNYEKLQAKCITLMEDLEKIDNPEQFLREYIKRMAVFYRENFEFFNILVTEDNVHIDSEMGDFGDLMSQFVSENIDNSCCEVTSIVLAINTFIYTLNLDIFHGIGDDGYEDKIEQFTNNMVKCLY